MHISEAQHLAAQDIVELVAARMASKRAVHPETAIAGAARLSGSLLLRSFELEALDKTEPGTFILSQEANDGWPMLSALIAAALEGMGAPVNQSNLHGAGSNLKSKLSFEDSLCLLQGAALQIAKKHELELEEVAQSAALATAFIVKECASQLSLASAFDLAISSLVEGSKTVPPSLDGSTTKKPWYKRFF